MPKTTKEIAQKIVTDWILGGKEWKDGKKTTTIISRDSLVLLVISCLQLSKKSWVEECIRIARVEGNTHTAIDEMKELLSDH